VEGIDLMALHRKGIQVARFHELLASDQRSAALYTRLARAVKGEHQNVLAVLPFLERAEHVDAGRYQADADATAAMAIDERSHARVLTRLRESDTTDDPRSIRRRERWHRGDRSGALRAAVFGVNDGMVSNTSLVKGFAGSGAPGSTILFAGPAGLMASAFSMSVGAVLVVLPFAFGSGLTALFVAIASAATALFVVGATIGLLNGRSAWRCGVRQFLLGGGAAVLVFIVGHLARVGAGA